MPIFSPPCEGERGSERLRSCRKVTEQVEQGGGILTQVFHSLGPGLGGRTPMSSVGAGTKPAARNNRAHLSCCPPSPALCLEVHSESLHGPRRLPSRARSHAAAWTGVRAGFEFFPSTLRRRKLTGGKCRVYRDRDLFKIPRELIPLCLFTPPNPWSMTPTP